MRFRVTAVAGVTLACLLAAGGSAPGPASAASAKRGPVHVARPGFTCSAGKPYQDEVWASATLDAEGRQLKAEWSWRPPLGAPEPHFLASSSVEGADLLRAGEGLITISWYRPGDRKPEKRLEIAAAPDGRFHNLPPFAGRYERERSSMLQASWPEFIAFARGAPSLWAVARGRDGAIRERAALDPAVFTGAFDRIGAAVEKLAQDVAHFRERCEPTDDVDPPEPDIMVMEGGGPRAPAQDSLGR